MFIHWISKSLEIVLVVVFLRSIGMVILHFDDFKIIFNVIIVVVFSMLFPWAQCN